MFLSESKTTLALIDWNNTALHHFSYFQARLSRKMLYIRWSHSII